MDQIASLDSILNQPIELWSLGYRLKAEPADQVMMAGGMNQEDGWITEDSSMGKPILVVSGTDNSVDFLGILWTGDLGSSQSGMEIGLRKMLIEKGDLPSEFFPGSHGVAQFNLSTGEKAQLLLSQPAQKGKDGIWCVESWMDGNGTVYYHDPQVDQGLAVYYEGLQSSKDETQQGWLTDPAAVASKFIIETLGQPLPEGGLVLMEEASYEDYMVTPVSRYIGYISSFGDPYPDMFHFDSIEWITVKDTERIRQLGINPEEMTNGFYIHNPRIDVLGFQVNEKTHYVLYDHYGNQSVSGSKGQFKLFMKEEPEREKEIPFVIETKDGYVISITQQYLP